MPYFSDSWKFIMDILTRKNVLAYKYTESCSLLTLFFLFLSLYLSLFPLSLLLSLSFSLSPSLTLSHSFSFLSTSSVAVVPSKNRFSGRQMFLNESEVRIISEENRHFKPGFGPFHETNTRSRQTKVSEERREERRERREENKMAEM